MGSREGREVERMEERKKTTTRGLYAASRLWYTYL